jgi:hypothetical protein
MGKVLNENLDPLKVQEQRTYFKNYYGSDFRNGQGLDEITDMVSRYSIPDTWIDLGGGTSTFIWLPAFRKIKEATSVDKSLESACVQKGVRLSPPSGCYTHILNRYNKTASEMNKIPISYLQLDLFDDFIVHKKYNNISQFGLLGLSRTKDKYCKQLVKLSAFMDSGSVFFGANWVFSNDYAKKQGFVNMYLDTLLIENIASKNKWMLLYNKRIKIIDDPCYDAVIIYAFVV